MQYNNNINYIYSVYP